MCTNDQEEKQILEAKCQVRRTALTSQFACKDLVLNSYKSAEGAIQARSRGFFFLGKMSTTASI